MKARFSGRYSIIPDEVKEYVGKAEPPNVRVVEKGAIRRYADAVGNDN